MTFKRLGLIILTLVAIAFLGGSLLESWQEPQFQSRLDLYQTNIVLQAAQWHSQDSSDDKLKAAQSALLGDQTLENALEQYQQTRSALKTNLQKAEKQLSTQKTSDSTQKSVKDAQKFITELDLQLGILQAQQKQTKAAISTWNELQQAATVNNEYKQTAAVLSGLWSDPHRLLPNAEELIQSNLHGWFRFTALSQLYQLQQRQDTLQTLEKTEQTTAQQAFLKLAIIGTIPALGVFIGVGLLLILILQRLLKGKAALLAQNADVTWSTPWDGETVLQVFLVGFFLMGQVVVPLLLGLLPIPHPIVSVRLQALLILVSYLLVASGSVLVLYLSIKPFFPLSPDWFRAQLRGWWFLWGLGGYCVALPIVLVVSLFNQKLWQGQGGSNPLLQIALESQDSVALTIFFITAAIAAPFFEEFLFRGFLLPSLTRYLPVWAAIITSSLLFAAAHLSLSEILPLTVLGIVLGTVYTRSRNLLSSILLHSLWNSGTLLSLFIIGGS